MTVRQRIHRVDGVYADHPLPNTYFDFWRIRAGALLEAPLTGGGSSSLDGAPGGLPPSGAASGTCFCMRDLREVPACRGPAAEHRRRADRVADVRAR